MSFAELMQHPQRRYLRAMAIACENGEIGAQNDAIKRQQKQQGRK